MSGMTAAVEAAEAGYEVVIVEKQAQLGGWANRLWKRVPFKGAYAEPQDTDVAALAAKVSAHSRIKVHLNSTVAETAGALGRFTVKVAQESGAVTEEAIGAIVQATGFTTYDIAKLPELGGGQANVIDQAGLEALAQAANGGVLKRADGKEIKSVAFLQCAGQRDETGKHLAYCCATSIKQAMYFKDGFMQGIRNAWAMQGIGFGLMRAKRLNPMELLGGHKCTDMNGVHKIIAKAREIEERNEGFVS